MLNMVMKMIVNYDGCIEAFRMNISFLSDENDSKIGYGITVKMPN